MRLPQAGTHGNNSSDITVVTHDSSDAETVKIGGEFCVPLMADLQLAADLRFFESLSKFFAATLGLLYLLGFLVVASYLSRYGVSSFAVLHLQYLIAGIWTLGPPVLLASLVYAGRRFDERAAPEVSGQFNWRRLAISSVITTVPSTLLLILFAFIPGVFEGMPLGTGIRLFLFFLAMVTCAQLLLMSRQLDSTRETWWLNRSHAAPFYLASMLMIVLCYAVWFSVRIYPKVPFSLGGGNPLTVAFLEGEKRMPDEIQKADRSAKRSVPYKLLLATDKSFVVVSLSDKERSLEISRDSVAGIVVLAAN